MPQNLSRNILFLVCGPEEGPIGRRARALAQGVSAGPVLLVYARENRLKTFRYFLKQIVKTKPQLIVVFENAVTGVFAALIGKMIGRHRVVLDTGDAIGELARSTAMRSRFGIWATHGLERLGYRLSDKIIVRGSFHQQYLFSLGFSNVEFIPDGYEPNLIRPVSSDLRLKLGLKGYFTFGVLGSSHWSEKLKMPYGWDIVEALPYLRGYPIKGILIGDGTGIAHLEQRTKESDVADQMVFLPAIPHDQIANYLSCIDICVSTQTDNLVGWVRTTGKLVEYMAHGKFVLATQVGEAAKVLPQEMLLPYRGIHDRDHPKRLADRVLSLYHHPEIFKLSALNRKKASQYFDYNVLRPRFASAIESLLLS